MDRPLTERERAVLDALLEIDFDGVDGMPRQAANVRVVDMCKCGCPSIDFHKRPGVGMSILVNAGVHGSYDGLFLYALGGSPRRDRVRQQLRADGGRAALTLRIRDRGSATMTERHMSPMRTEDGDFDGR